MSEKKESPPANCSVPWGPHQGQIVNHGDEFCFPEGNENGQNTLHLCNNGNWENKGDPCTPPPPDPEK